MPFTGGKACRIGAVSQNGGIDAALPTGEDAASAVGFSCPRWLGADTQASRWNVDSSLDYQQCRALFSGRIGPAWSLLEESSMKTSERLVFENECTSRSTRRVIQKRPDAEKPPAHRYERRKVREYLRQVDWADEAAFTFSVA